jgi:hypothetical protein
MPDPQLGRPFDEVNNWLDWLHPQLLVREAEKSLKTESSVGGQGLKEVEK